MQIGDKVKLDPTINDLEGYIVDIDKYGCCTVEWIKGDKKQTVRNVPQGVLIKHELPQT